MSVGVGNPKPLCWRCLRRVDGVAKGGGWWCAGCKAWIILPQAPRRRPDTFKRPGQ